MSTARQKEANQKYHYRTLAQLAACPETFEAPLIAVVGEVVGLSVRLRWFGDAPLPFETPLRRLG